MTRGWKLLAGFGAGILGLACYLGASALMNHIEPHPSLLSALVRFVLCLALFAVTSAAVYTWAVDGPLFRRRRRRRVH